MKEPQREYLACRISYSERQRNNRSLGERGETSTFEFEKFRLTQAGREDLAKEVKLVSRDDGDGLDYDIRSFSLHQDDELSIEVKKTTSGKYQSFFKSEMNWRFRGNLKSSIVCIGPMIFDQMRGCFSWMGMSIGMCSYRLRIIGLVFGDALMRLSRLRSTSRCDSKFILASPRTTYSPCKKATRNQLHKCLLEWQYY